VAQSELIEIAFPWKELDRPAGAGISFCLEITAGSQVLDRYPRQGGLELRVPGEDYETVF